MHIVDSLDIGGLENFVINLANNLDSSKYNIHVCCLNHPGSQISRLNSNIHIHCLHKKKGIDHSLFFKLSKLLKKYHIHIIHTHNTNPYRYGTIAGILASVSKIINTDHNSLAYLKGRKQFLFNYLLSFFNAKITVVSHNLAKKHIRLRNFTKNKIKTIHNGINLNYKKINKIQKIKQLNKDIQKNNQTKSITNLNYNKINTSKNKQQPYINSKGAVIIAIGRLSPEKDHFTLISAFNRLPQKNIKLLIVGDGPLRKKLEDFSCNKNIIFLGYRNDISELLQISDIFLLTSLTEGTSLTILEAMLHKIPIIATNTGGTKEMLQNYVSGILIPIKNPKILSERISFLLKNPEISKNLSENAYDVLKNRFDFRNTIKEYEKIYQK